MIVRLLLAFVLLLSSTISLSVEPNTFDTAQVKKIHAKGLLIPKDWKSKATFKDPAPKKGLLGLPRHWDWREQGTLSAIDDQRDCGSCWSFSTTAALQDSLSLRKISNNQLSEQFLMSCNTQGWGCNGGWFAHDYHVNPGAVLAQQFPYQARDGIPCPLNLNHPYKIASWAYIPTTSPDGVPAITDIKQAIFQYGTVSAGVAANDAFEAYTSGIFNGCDNGATQPNHAINLIGWDDDGQYWIMRNSWNTSWGEKGYMRIKYGCNFIGVSANYIVVNNTPIVKCTPMPVVSISPNISVKQGTTVTIGMAAQPGTTYRWESSVLHDPVATQITSMVKITPQTSRAYTLYATTKCGVAKGTEIVYVRYRRDR